MTAQATRSSVRIHDVILFYTKMDVRHPCTIFSSRYSEDYVKDFYRHARHQMAGDTRLAMTSPAPACGKGTLSTKFLGRATRLLALQQSEKMQELYAQGSHLSRRSLATVPALQALP